MIGRDFGATLEVVNGLQPTDQVIANPSDFVIAFVVLPAFLGCDVEDNVLAVVLSGFGFCVLSEAADEDDFIDYVFLALCAAQ
jgi:hypothetical protein